jgi:hypothetical protein
MLELALTPKLYFLSCPTIAVHEGYVKCFANTYINPLWAISVNSETSGVNCVN